MLFRSKAVTLDKDPGDVSTIEEEGSVDEARHAWEEMRSQLAASQSEAPR